MVKTVRKGESRQFLEQAGEFLASAKENLEHDRYNAAAFNAVQAVINSNDALTIFFLERKGSFDHREAIDLHAEVVKKLGDATQKEHLKEAFAIRNNAGYMGEVISKSDAERAVRLAVLFIEWVRRHVR